GARTLLDALAPADVAGYQPYWVTLAGVLTACDDPSGAHQALQRAIGLTEDPAVREFLGRDQAASNTTPLVRMKQP
ncbi:MAG: hypothetical protein RL375_4251, partial [Pseudomonadota bacterium]